MATAPSFLKPIDPALASIIQTTIHQASTPREQALRLAGEQLVEWLAQQGRFIQALGGGELYYLYRPEHRLFHLESDRFKSWLYLLTLVNPSSKNFQFLWSDCRTAA